MARRGIEKITQSGKFSCKYRVSALYYKNLFKDLLWLTIRSKPEILKFL